MSIIKPLAAISVLFALISPRGFSAEEDVRQVHRGGEKVRSVVFICDAGDSTTPKMDVLREELSKSVSGLRPVQKFNAFFMRAKEPAAFSPTLEVATPEIKDKFKAFVAKFEAGGETDPVPAVTAALKLKPDLVYLLADHDFAHPEALVARIRELNEDKQIKVNTIAFVGKDEKIATLEDTLKQIAKENDGVFKLVNPDDLK